MKTLLLLLLLLLLNIVNFRIFTLTGFLDLCGSGDYAYRFWMRDRFVRLYIFSAFNHIFDFAWTLKSGGVGGSLGSRVNAINTSHPRLRLPSIPNREFKQWRQRRQWERQKKKKKTVGLDWQNRQLCTCITLFYTSCDIMCLISRFV